MVNQNCVNRDGVHGNSPAQGRVRVSSEHCQAVLKGLGNHKHDLLRLGSSNVGT